METMQEYMNLTKGVSYLIAVAIMVGFIPFWRFLVDREEDDE